MVVVIDHWALKYKCVFMRLKENEFKKPRLKYNELLQCEKCKKLVRQLEYDHKLPIMMGGTNDILNLQKLCYSCHYRKTTIDKRIYKSLKSLGIMNTEGYSKYYYITPKEIKEHYFKWYKILEEIRQQTQDWYKKKGLNY